MINLIVAIDRSGAIGRNGSLIYSIHEDLRHFKALTSGHTVVMGRKTFESLPKGALPNRRNIVITGSPDFSAPGVEVAHSLDQALAMAAEGPGETFIIGGGRVYAEAMPHASRLYLTLVDAPSPSDADTFFPPVDPEQWSISDRSEAATDPASGLSYSFVTLDRSCGV